MADWEAIRRYMNQQRRLKELRDAKKAIDVAKWRFTSSEPLATTSYSALPLEPLPTPTPQKITKRAEPLYKPEPERPDLPSWLTNKNLTVAPMSISDRTFPNMPIMLRRHLMAEAKRELGSKTKDGYPYRVEDIAKDPESAVSKAISVAKESPSAVYRAMTQPVKTAKNIANAIFSGEDYQSTGDPVVQNGVINWGDPDNASDFFRADRAMQELYPYKEEERRSGGRVGYATEGAVVADTSTASAPATREQIQDLYQTQLGREADAGGLDYWDSTDLSYNDLMPHFYDASIGSSQSAANDSYQSLAGYPEMMTAINRSKLQGLPVADIISQKGQYLGFNPKSQNAINTYLKGANIVPKSIGNYSEKDLEYMAAMALGEAGGLFGLKTDEEAAAEAWNRAVKMAQGDTPEGLSQYRDVTNFNKASEDYNRRVAERAGTNLANFSSLGPHNFFTYGNEADRLAKFNEIPNPPPRPDDLSINFPAVGATETSGAYEFNPLDDVSSATPNYDNYTVGLDTSYKSMPTFTNLSVNPSDYGSFSGSGDLGGASGLTTFSTDLNDYSNAGLNLGYGGNSWDGFGGWGSESYFADGGAAKGEEPKRKRHPAMSIPGVHIVTAEAGEPKFTGER